VTIVVYAVLATARGSGLDTETAFTTVAILALVTHPANMIMTIVPRAVASFSSFERIQKYLQEPTVQDQRTSPLGGGPITARSPPAIHLHDLTVNSKHTSRNILQDINLEIPQGSLVICSGAVGSGKSSLCRVVLGEVAPTSGTVSVISRKISFCDQIPWLPNKTIKDCIYGLESQSPRDIGRYQSAIAACCIDQDLRELPGHDGTLVGNMGLNLSGGQRQRVVRPLLSLTRAESLTSIGTCSCSVCTK
jgi:ATP-binding cassette, subfamily C (CFTR/MRP), member 1